MGNVIFLLLFCTFTTMRPPNRSILNHLLVCVLLLYCQNIVAQCGNISFENGTFSGWRGEVGCVTDQIAINTNCAEAHNGIDPQGGSNSFSGQHAILSNNFNGGQDPFVPFIKMVSPLGDKFIARLGDYRATTIVENFARGASLEYDFQVTELNALITLYFAIVLQDPEDHAYGERPFFSVDIIDPTGNTVECINYVVAAQRGIDGFAKHDDYFYRNWTPVSINLKQYAGKKVTLRVVTSDCGQEAHLGYAYMDATCQAPIISSPKDVICPGETLVLEAPPGMQTYKWRKQSTGQLVIGSDQTLTITAAGSYSCEMVPFSTSNTPCPFTLTKVIENPQGTVNPSLEIEPETVCLGETITLNNTSQVDNTSLVFLEWSANGTVINQNANPYTYSANPVGKQDIVMELTDADGCKYSATGEVEVVAPPKPEIETPDAFCNDDPPFQLTYSPLGGVWEGNGVNQNGVFNPALAGFAGSPHTLRYTITNVCSRSSSIPVTVIERKDPTIAPAGPFCNDDGNFQLQAAQSGGTWLGVGVSSSGVFSPSTAGPGFHTITYKFGGKCPSEDKITIEVIRRKDPSVVQPPTFCFNDPPYQFQATEPGGRWSGPGINPNTGVFNPSSAGSGEHNIVHNFDGPCPSQRITRIKVILKANAEFQAPATICENEEAVRLVPVSSQGTFSGNGIQPGNLFNPQLAGPGTHKVTYLIKGSCGDTVEKNIVVHPFFDATIDPVAVLCDDRDPFNLTAKDNGGNWSGTGIVNSSTGLFDPGLAGEGMHTITHSFGGNCPSQDDIVIEVRRRKNADFSLPTKACSKDDAITLNALEDGGTWSGPGVSGNQFDPKVAGVGKHTVTYNLPGLCGDVKSRTIEVFSQPDASILGPVTACILEDPIQINVRQSGGKWQGLGVDQNGVFDPKVPGEGTHQLIYHFDGNCTASDTLSIKVTSKLDATITPVDLTCNDELPFNLSAVDPNGVWTGNGITNNQTGRFNPNVAGKGIHTITYTISGLCGDTATLDIQVENRADARILSATRNYCFGAVNDTLNATPGGEWHGPALSTNGVFQPSTLNPGNYKLFYEIDSLCPDVDSISVLVLDPISLQDSQLENPKCFGDCNGTLNLNAQGGMGFNYRYVMDSTSTSSNGVFSQLCEGNYYVEIRDDLGCTFDTSFSFIEPDSLYANISSTDEKCDKQNGGAEVTSIVGGTSPYQVTWSDGATGLSNYQFAAGVHSYTVQDSMLCTYTDTFTVGIVPGPIVYTSFDSVSCFGYDDGLIRVDSVRNGVPPYDLLWSNSASSNQIDNLLSGVYSIRVKDSEDCLGHDTIALPQPSQINLVHPPFEEFCDGQSFTFKPSATGGNGSKYQFHFYELARTQDSLVSDSSLSVKLYATDIKGCYSDTTNFDFIELEPLAIEIIKDTVVCPNSTITFSTIASGGLPSDYNFEWNDGFIGSSRDISFDNSGAPKKYSIILHDNCSNPAFDTVSIAFYDPSIAGFRINPDPAKGCEPLTVSLIDTSINSVIQRYFINGEESSSLNPKLFAGSYNVMQKVISAEGCRDSMLIENAIEVYPIPLFDLFVNPSDPTELSEYLQLQYRSSVPLVEFEWLLQDRNSLDTVLYSEIARPEIIGQQVVGFYEVFLHAKSQFGCFNMASYRFEIKPETRVYIPTAFTPNGDGDNDVFTVYGANTDREDMVLRVFNRWGELVYESSDPLNEPWDGKHMRTNTKAPQGVYVWRLETTDPLALKKEFKGTVTLIR